MQEDKKRGHENLQRSIDRSARCWKRRAAERQRAEKIGFLALAKEVAQENAEALRLLAKH